MFILSWNLRKDMKLIHLNQDIKSFYYVNAKDKVALYSEKLNPNVKKTLPNVFFQSTSRYHLKYIGKSLHTF